MEMIGIIGISKEIPIIPMIFIEIPIIEARGAHSARPIQECLNIRMFERSNVRMSECSNVRNVRLFECQSARMSEKSMKHLSKFKPESSRNRSKIVSKSIQNL